MNAENVAIEVKDVSKQYRLGEIGSGTISKDLNRWWAKLRGKPDPYLRMGEVNDRTKKGGEFVWALKDLNFNINQGEIVGIIGKNGAGKSTLLKLLSKVTGPTTGTIKAKGRIAALLEVGTGFHPEMTGRENIYMNGTIMGMTRKEINEKLDEIVEFSGIAKYIDTPVKRYSSGMTVRLGFAIAAHLEPEILIVDEVLAVGDAEFQKKAIGKMKDVSGKGGRTVLFVSHNLGSIESLCAKCILMKNGQIQNIGPTKDIIEEYLNIDENSFLSANEIKRTVNLDDCKFSLDDISFWQNGTKQVGNSFFNGYPLEIKMQIEVTNDLPTFQFVVNIYTESMVLLSTSFRNEKKIMGEELEMGRYCLSITMPSDLFVGGNRYYVQPTFSITGKHLIHDIILPLEFAENGLYGRMIIGQTYNGELTLPIDWSTEKLNN